MHRKLPVLFIVLAVVALLCTVSADAQDQPQRRRIFGGFDRSSPMALLRYEAVQKELKLDESKLQAVNELQNQRREAMSGRLDRGALRNMSASEREAAMTKWREQRDKVDKEYETKLVSVIGEDAMKRLGEIGIQVRGGAALRDEKTAKQLELTDEQTGKIEAIYTASREKMRELFQAENRDREAFTKLTEETNAKYLAVLTDEQKKKFEAMKGKEFDTSQLRRQRRQEV